MASMQPWSPPSDSTIGWPRPTISLARCRGLSRHWARRKPRPAAGTACQNTAEGSPKGLSVILRGDVTRRAALSPTSLQQGRTGGQRLAQASARERWRATGLRRIRLGEISLSREPAGDRRRLWAVPGGDRTEGRRTGPALSSGDVRGVLRVVWNRQALRRHRLDRRPSERLPVCATRRHPRLPQRSGRAYLDLDAVCSRRAARALLRGFGASVGADRRRASRVVHQERQLLHRVTSNTPGCEYARP